MNKATEREVRRIAGGICEYCRFPEENTDFKHVLDHIIAEQHGGSAEVGNLALACGFCNRHKGPNIAGIDPETGRICRLFHPRRDKWTRHFRMKLGIIIGLTSIGRTTISVLAMNNPEQLAVRRFLMDEAS